MGEGILEQICIRKMRVSVYDELIEWATLYVDEGGWVCSWGMRHDMSKVKIGSWKSILGSEFSDNMPGHSR